MKDHPNASQERPSFDSLRPKGLRIGMDPLEGKEWAEKTFSGVSEDHSISEAGIEHLSEALNKQVASVLEEMGKASEKLAKKGRELFKGMQDLGRQVVEGSLPPEDAERAFANYLHAINLYKLSVDNKDKIEVFLRAKAMLEVSKTIFFTLLKLAVSVYAPSAMVLVDGLEEVTKE